MKFKIKKNSTYVIAEIGIESSIKNINALIELKLDNEIVNSSKLRVQKGKQHFSIPIKIDNPKLWWPNGLGKQHLYNIKVNIKRNEIVVFNQPADTLQDMNDFTPDRNYYKPIDKKTNLVKRCVAIAGDTLEVINGYVYINGNKNKLPDEAKLQFSYLVQPKKNRFSKKVMINKYDITDAFGIINRKNTYKFMGMSDAALNKFKYHPNVQWIVKDTLPGGYRDSTVFPQNENYNWNNDFFGPIYIPKKGKTIEINTSNMPLYKRVIDIYENNDLFVKGDKIYINNKETSEYTFKQNYYWLMGDNRGNSQDSRSWGFVPFDHVVGKPVFKWFSWDSNAKGLSKIRWNRLFTSISGTGGPINLFFGFITILIIFWLLSIDYSNFKKGWNKSKK
mgnify:CR=1 FL=1